MTDIDQARELLLSAAMSYVASRLHIEASAPGAYDDAQMELHSDLLDQAVDNYVDARKGDS